MSERDLIQLTPNQSQPEKKEEDVEKSNQDKLLTENEHAIEERLDDEDSKLFENERYNRSTKATSAKQSTESADSSANADKYSTPKREITKIQAQKRKGRYNIYLDDEYAFPVDESILIKHMLMKGSHVSVELQKQLETEDNFSKAYTRALNYLSYALRTEKQVRDDLADKEFEAFSDAVIEKLKDQRLINDLEYAKSYVRTAANLNRKGPNLIARELITKGVGELLIEEAMDEYPHDLQVENAAILIEKRMKKPNKSSERHKMNKINAYLYGKGFTNNVINEAFDQVEPEVSEDEEYASLVKQADKAYRRYELKASGYELIQKVKAYVYSKGYPSDLINRYIDQKNEDVY